MTSIEDLFFDHKYTFSPEYEEYWFELFGDLSYIISDRYTMDYGINLLATRCIYFTYDDTVAIELISTGPNSKVKTIVSRDEDINDLVRIAVSRLKCQELEDKINETCGDLASRRLKASQPHASVQWPKVAQTQTQAQEHTA